MAVITIHKGNNDFEGESYTVDTERPYDGQENGEPIFQKGDIICSVAPFFGVPLVLGVAIRNDGKLIFRSWMWGNGNHYLHTSEKDIIPTEEQIDTVSGLFSGRIKFEGIKIAVGASVQKICPIDLKKEEEKVNRKIYLA